MKGERGVIFLQLEYFSILFFVLRDRYYIQYFEAKQHDFLIHKTKSQVAIMKQIGILIHELCVVPILICHNIQPVTRSRSCKKPCPFLVGPVDIRAIPQLYLGPSMGSLLQLSCTWGQRQVGFFSSVII